MKSIVFIALILGSFNLFASCFEVAVSVDKYKANGGSWDVLSGNPDIKVCFRDSWGYRCKVKVVPPKKHYPWCEDSYTCNLGVIYFPDEKVNVEVIDFDKFTKNDPIDFKDCIVGNDCQLGSAKISFSNKACHK